MWSVGELASYIAQLFWCLHLCLLFVCCCFSAKGDSHRSSPNARGGLSKSPEELAYPCRPCLLAKITTLTPLHPPTQPSPHSIYPCPVFPRCCRMHIFRSWSTPTCPPRTTTSRHPPPTRKRSTPDHCRHTPRPRLRRTAPCSRWGAARNAYPVQPSQGYSVK